MTDVQELADELNIPERTVHRLIQRCIKEGFIDPPEKAILDKGKGDRITLILPDETRRILRIAKARRENEISDVELLAKVLFLSRDALRKTIKELVGEEKMPPPKMIRNRIVLTISQRMVILQYYEWIREPSPVTKLAKELKVAPLKVRKEICQLVPNDGLSMPEKRRRGSSTELVLSKEMKKAIRESFNQEEGATFAST